MRGLFHRVILALLAVAIITAAPGWRKCAHVNGSPDEASVHSLDCTYLRALPAHNSPPSDQSDDEACCALCKMEAAADAMLLAPATSVALVWRSHARISSVATVVRLRSQTTSSSNHARAPPTLS
jgi:hypothetical protein